MDLYLLNELNKLEAGGVGASSTGLSAFLPDYLDGSSPKGKHTWMAISRHNSRYSQDNTRWSSSNYQTTHYTYLNNTSDKEFHFADALGKTCADHGNQSTYITQFGGGSPNIHFAKDDVIGYWGANHGAQNNTSYMPMRSMVMFVKNPTNTQIQATCYTYMSMYWSSGHDGSAVAVGTPNAADNASVTQINWSTVVNRSGSSSYHDNNSFTLTVPANTTVCILLAASSYHWTSTTYQYYASSEETQIYNLQTLADAGLECDLEMTLTALQHRDSYNNYTNNAYRIWNATARNFPPAAE